MSSNNGKLPEALVQQIVDARVGAMELQHALADAEPKTISLDRAKLIAQLRAFEKDLLEKHKQAVRLWQKSWKIHLDYLKKNPGSQRIESPDKRPSLGEGIEHIRADIRRFECVPSKVIVLSRNEWQSIFQQGAHAVASMRQLRDRYTNTMFSSGSTSNSTLSIGSVVDVNPRTINR